LAEAKKEGRLFGILNGCEYPATRATSRITVENLCAVVLSEARSWYDKKPAPILAETIRRVEHLRAHPPAFILTSVTRVVEQKVRLLFEKGTREQTAMERILEFIERRNGLCIVLGTGTPDYESKLEESSAKHSSFLYLRGYSDPIAK